MNVPFERLHQPLDAPASAPGRQFVTYTDAPGPITVSLPEPHYRQQVPVPATPAPPPYVRSVIWRKIVKDTGATIASKSELDTLRALQTEYGRWESACANPADVQGQLADAWQEAIKAGRPVDPLGFPTVPELEARHQMMSAIAQQHKNALSLEALPIVNEILQRIPALADKLAKAEEKKEERAVADARERGCEYTPTVWLRHLRSTQWEVNEQLAHNSRATDYKSSPAAMLAGILDLL